MVSDCGAIADIDSPHHYAKSAAGASADAINGGCDANCGDSALVYLEGEAPLPLVYLEGEAPHPLVYLEGEAPHPLV